MIFKTSKEIYAHIDANCFFVSCERIRNPSLCGKFVVVAGDIVIAASYECRKFQIKVGTPIWEAEQILGKRLIKIRPDLRYYAEISGKFMDFLASKSLAIEPFSIDEAFIHITGIPERTHGGDCEAYSNDLKTEILQKIGIPVSVGIANTRIKSKIFSDINKPFWHWVGLDDDKEEIAFKKLPVREVPFIGKATESRLGKSVRTVADFRNMGFFELDRLIGKNATTLWLELHGVDVWKNEPRPHPKSILRSRSFNHALTDNRYILWQRVLENFEKAYRELILIRCELAGVSILFREKDFSKSGYSYEFWENTNDRHLILEKLKECFDASFRPGSLYRTTGVIFSSISSAAPKQLSVFEIHQQQTDRCERLEETLERLNLRYGKRTVSYGVHPEQIYGK